MVVLLADLRICGRYFPEGKQALVLGGIHGIEFRRKIKVGTSDVDIGVIGVETAANPWKAARGRLNSGRLNLKLGPRDPKAVTSMISPESLGIRGTVADCLHSREGLLMDFCRG